MNDLDRLAIAEASRLVIQKGSKSFAAAAKLFDADTRASAYMLYAWCRHCDDRIDNQELGFNSKPQSAVKTQAILKELRSKTQCAIDNEPCDDTVFEGLRYVIHRHQIPGRYPLELLDGFAMDATAFEYRNLADTLRYCYHVAGVVGVMMAAIMGARGGDVLQRAADLGIAFQLTNIARDIREDAEVGRIYLPGDWLAGNGIAREALLQPQHRGAVVNMVGRLLDEADRYYASANEGLRALGFRSAWAVSVARVVYRSIGDIVRQRGETAWDQRVVVAKSRKLAGVGQGLLSAARACLFDRRTDPVRRDGDLWTAPTH